MIGIVADDITGGNDIGVMYAKAGVRTHVYLMDAWHPAQAGLPQALVIDTNSRLDRPEEAYRKAYDATLALRDAGCDRYFNKTCSVFRGNIGAEFDAMLDALGASFMIVALGFPKNGRTTLGGIHYVRGEPLELSEFRYDPVHPMTRSNLLDILGSQTKRRVDGIPIEIVEKGPAALRREIERKRKSCNYLIVDVRDQESLRTIAEAVRDEPVLGGSSALAEELAPLWPGRQAVPDDSSPSEPAGAGGVFCAAGSLMPQTAAQIACAKRHGVAAFELDSLILLDQEKRERHMAERVRAVCAELAEGRSALLYASNDRQKVAETKRRAAALGLSNNEASRLVSDALSGAAAAVVRASGTRRLLVAGGETSAAVCAKLGIGGLRILREIEPGLPSCLSLGDTPIRLVLKSGSFGSETFFMKAIDHLNAPCPDRQGRIHISIHGEGWGK